MRIAFAKNLLNNPDHIARVLQMLLETWNFRFLCRQNFENFSQRMSGIIVSKKQMKSE